MRLGCAHENKAANPPERIKSIISTSAVLEKKKHMHIKLSWKKSIGTLSLFFFHNIMILIFSDIFFYGCLRDQKKC